MAARAFHFCCSSAIYRARGRGLFSVRFSTMPSPGAEEELAAAAAASATGEQKISKKAAKKAAKKDEKAARTSAALAATEEEVDALAGNYGDLKLEAVQSSVDTGRTWTKVAELDSNLDGKLVLVRGRVGAIRVISKGRLTFLTLRESGYTVQCVATIVENLVSRQMVKYVGALNKESVVDVEGVVTVPTEAIASTSQSVELKVRKLYCVAKAESPLLLNIEDAARSEAEIEKAKQEGVQYVTVLQDTRLDNRVLDLRTPANLAIFRLQSEFGRLFRDFLHTEGFIEIHTPKLNGGASEGGASVFKLDYKGKPACLAQSPQLHKQMCISAGFGRVFEIGPVFRAENSFTHRHLCEFTGLDAEMEIKEHYAEVMDLVGKLFVDMFKKINENCKRELAAVDQQYQFEPLVYLDETLHLTFAEGIELLRADNRNVDPLGDFNTETEKRLGQLVKEKYKTDFYILHRYPLGVRPFYTMPAADDSKYSNSFDVFIRGEEIISGAQRVHDVHMLKERARECGIDLDTISTYLDSFRWGTPPHGGFGVGLERVVMLFCGLNNIRKTSLFPRDPQRLAP